MIDSSGNTAEPATVSVAEAGRRLSVGRNLAYKGVADGTIPSIRIGRRIVVPVPALERLLAGEKLDAA